MAMKGPEMEIKGEASQGFLSRFLASESALRGYILAHGCDFNIAEDLLQQTALVLWKKFDQYDPSRPFVPWALGIARLEVLNRNRSPEKAHALLDADLAEKLAGSYEEEADLERRRQLLRSCVRRLSGSMRDATLLRYEQGSDLEAIGKRLGKSLSAVKVLLHRARLALEECVKRQLSAEEA